MDIPVHIQARSAAYVETQIKRELKQPAKSLASKDLSPSSTSTSLPFLLKQCGKAKALDEGKLLHSHICKFLNVHNTFLGNCLVEMYGDCGDMVDAASTFEHITELNLHSWNILINAYAKNGHCHEALQAYHDMQHHEVAPNPHTFVCVLKACGISTTLTDVWEIHSAIINNGYSGQVIVCTALISAYSKSGSLRHASIVFDHIPVKDVISWNAMLAACTENGSFHEALILFKCMKREGFD
eukprot:c34024_g1_i1 orf=84-806(+)